MRITTYALILLDRALVRLQRKRGTVRTDRERDHDHHGLSIHRPGVSLGRERYLGRGAAQREAGRNLGTGPGGVVHGPGRGERRHDYPHRAREAGL